MQWIRLTKSLNARMHRQLNDADLEECVVGVAICFLSFFWTGQFTLRLPVLFNNSIVPRML